MNTAINGHERPPVLLQPAAPPVEFSAEQLHFHVTMGSDFRATEEIDHHHDFTGQERARAAIDLGLGVASSGYNIFVSGLMGIEKLEALRTWVSQQVAQAPTPGDWVYVHNFTHPDTPRAIPLATGQGRRLKFLMSALVKMLQEELPKAFRQESFNKEKAQIKEQYVAKAKALVTDVEARIRKQGFLMQAGPSGDFLLIPLVNGTPLIPEEFANLGEKKRRTIASNQRRVATELDEFTAKQQEILRALAADIRQSEQRFCESLLTPFLAKISREMDSAEIKEYLAEVKVHLIEHLDDFKEPERLGPMLPFPLAFSEERSPFLEYDVNVVVDNSTTQGALVLVETAPTYLNLFGTIERVVDRFGRLVTNFTRIKSGSLLRAQGGYLIFSLEDALTELGVWKTLKRTLKNGRIEMETSEPFALFATTGLKPEPIAIQTKVIVVGSPLLYHVLYLWDEEFREVFKVHVDFRPTMEGDAQHLLAYGHWVAQVCRQEGLPHCDRSGLERLVEFGARKAEDRQQVSASYAEITDLVREAAYWARKDNGQVISARHVQKALDERIFRANRPEDEIRALITQGTILVELDGWNVGQVNGLSLLYVGDHRFGRPSRVTASVAMGRAGIVNIERESRLSGSLHDKGLLILSGYLRNRYGQDTPLTLSASVWFRAVVLRGRRRQRGCG